MVHETGGLADTVIDHETGWTFAGEDTVSRQAAFIATFAVAWHAAKGASADWRRISIAAAGARFTWEQAAAAYEALYVT